jgi:hypothetical protein
VYWVDDDVRTVSAHRGILAQIILDFEPFNMVNRRGFLIDKRQTMPDYMVHQPNFYADLMDKVLGGVY